jgi:ribosome-associated protein
MKPELDVFIKLISEKKGENILFVDIEEGLHPICDHIIVASATNRIHLSAMVDALKRCFKDHKSGDLSGLDFFGLSGTPESNWVILDFNNILIHIIEKELREQYDFDNLFAQYDSYRYH